MSSPTSYNLADFWTSGSNIRPFSQCLMGDLHVFMIRYVCPKHDVKPGCLITDSWDSYKKHVKRHVHNNELEASWQVPSCRSPQLRHSIRNGRCR